MKLDFKSKMAEIDKKNPAKPKARFRSKQYDGIKVTVDNLMTEIKV